MTFNGRQRPRWSRVATCRPTFLGSPGGELPHRSGDLRNDACSAERVLALAVRNEPRGFGQVCAGGGRCPPGWTGLATHRLGLAPHDAAHSAMEAARRSLSR